MAPISMGVTGNPLQPNFVRGRGWVRDRAQGIVIPGFSSQSGKYLLVLTMREAQRTGWTRALNACVPNGCRVNARRASQSL